MDEPRCPHCDRIRVPGERVCGGCGWNLAKPPEFHTVLQIVAAAAVPVACVAIAFRVQAQMNRSTPCG